MNSLRTPVNSCFQANGLQICVLFVYLHELLHINTWKQQKRMKSWQCSCKHLFPDVAGPTGTRVLVERSSVRSGEERVLLFFSACSSGFGWVWTERPQEWPALERPREWRWSRKSSPDTTSSPAWGNSPGEDHHHQNNQLRLHTTGLHTTGLHTTGLHTTTYYRITYYRITYYRITYYRITYYYILPDYILPDYILPDYILQDYILPDYILPDYILPD